jgi:GNAT superfamily N-acetyltransferase
MAISRSWRPVGVVDGPQRATAQNIGELNDVFSAAFTDRYRRDGLVGVRVPFLNPAVWRYAIEDAADGAMIWRDERGGIAAFNMVHRSGTEGWMGPLAVRADQQGHGLGKEIVLKGLEWLRGRGATVIGLETMPRTVDNIGFYSRLGFTPGHLTLTLSLDAARHEAPVEALSRLGSQSRAAALVECHALLQRVLPGLDFSREITLTSDLELGETLLIYDHGALVAFALAHTAPLVEGRTRDELRVLKLIIDDERRFGDVARSITDFARRAGTRRVAFRIQGEYAEAYRQLVGIGAHVRWSDLRMSHDGYRERRPALGMVLSNWEI